MAKTKIAKRILTLANKITKDHKNSNLYLEILDNFQVEDDEVLIACCDSAGKVFNHYIISTDFIELKASEDEEEISKEHQFLQWLQEQFKTTCDILFGLLAHNSIPVQISAMESLAAVVNGLGERKSDPCVSQVNYILGRVMAVLSDKDHDRSKLIPELPKLLSGFDDNSDAMMRCLYCLHNKLCQKEKISDIGAFNVWHAVMQISSHLDLDVKAKGLLNKIVLGFLKQELPLKLYKDILTSIDVVMEKMTTPLLLADFLSQSFSIGGAISLMSLNGLFVLMHKYSLNYPDFYEKLYSMFQPQIFGARYRARFFHLADLFLSSTHLPSYLVAAFIKRLARLALHAPATGVRIVIPFIFSLIKRHPACDVLIHKVTGPMELTSDPYLPDKPISECHALDSCIWELRTLEHHFDPNISSKARKRQIKEVDLSSLLETTVTEIIESEAKKKKKEVALTFAKSTDFNLLGTFVL